MQIGESSLAKHIFGPVNFPHFTKGCIHTMLWSRAGCITRCGRRGVTCWSSLLSCDINVGEVDNIIWMVKVSLRSYNVLVIFNAYICTLCMYILG